MASCGLPVPEPAILPYPGVAFVAGCDGVPAPEPGTVTVVAPLEADAGVVTVLDRG